MFGVGPVNFGDAFWLPARGSGNQLIVRFCNRPVHFERLSISFSLCGLFLSHVLLLHEHPSCRMLMIWLLFSSMGDHIGSCGHGYMRLISFGEIGRQ